MPSALHSALVPACSSAFEPSVLPPSPTQNAEALVPVDVQSIAGCTQVPVTDENSAPVTT